MPYLIDLHCHTLEKSYDGRVPAAEIVRALAAEGFHGVVFTDHNNVWSAAELQALRAASGVGPAFLLASGQEVRTQVEGLMGGDLLVYGPMHGIPDGTEAAEVIRVAREANGFLIAAHPPLAGIGFGRHLGDFPVDACEVWNGRYGARMTRPAELLAREHDLARTGGSDAHRPADIAGGGTLFHEMPDGLDDLKRLIAAHQCTPWRPSTTKRLAQWLRGSEAE